MAKFDQEKRNFLKGCLLFVGLFALNFGLEGNLLAQTFKRRDQVGVLFSMATGVVLRSINPGPGEQSHLDWLDENKPEGTILLRLNKLDVGADDHNMPNLDFLIPYAKQNHGLALSFGQSHVIINEQNEAVENVLCCPVLYQNNLALNHRLVPGNVTRGTKYNPETLSFEQKIPARLLS